MIENLFKNELAYILAREFGVDVKDYLDKLKYRKYIKNKKKRLSVKGILDTILSDISKMGNPTKHYNMTHNHIPPWILLKNIKFHTAIQIFESLNNTERNYVSDRLIDNDVENKNGIIKNMLNIIRLYRNEIVHNYKFTTYNNRIDVSVTGIAPLIPSEMLEPKSKGKNAYTVILCVLTLLGSDRLRVSFIDDIINFIETSTLYDASIKNLYNTYFNLLDLPNDFARKIHWYKQYLISSKGKLTNHIVVQANINSRIYHMPGGVYYNKIHKDNLLIFHSEIEAIKAGYKKSKR